MRKARRCSAPLHAVMTSVRKPSFSRTGVCQSGVNGQYGPTALGTVTNGTMTAAPDDSTRVTPLPGATDAPAAGVCEITVPEREELAERRQLGILRYAWEWCGYGEPSRPKIKDPKAFGTYLRENFLMLRRTRTDVGRELPDVIKIPHRIDADTSALATIEGSAAELAKIILAQGESHKGAKFEAGQELSNLLRQATGIAKAPYVADFVCLLLESEERVILAGWHRAVYAIWEEKLTKAGKRVGYYTGSENPAKKQEVKDAFVKGDLDVVFLSLRSGAGLDGLQEVCNTAVFGELDWSPAAHEQLIGRLHRDGQENHVSAYFLVSDYGADPIMSEVLGLKREQLAGIRDPKQNMIEKLQTDGNNAKKLAEHFLKSKGIVVPKVSPIVRLRMKDVV